MPLKGALVGWQGSSSQGGGTADRPISLSKYPENYLEGIYWGLNKAGISFGDYARVKAGVGFPRFPVGPAIDRRDIAEPTSYQLPTLVPAPRGGPPQGIFREDPGRSLPQIKEVLPVQAAIPIPALPQVRTGPSSEDGGPIPSNIHVGARKMPDLGSIFEGHFGLPGWEGIADLGANILGWSGSGPTQVPAVVNPPVVQAAPAGGGPPLPPGGGGSCGTEDPRNQYVLKFSCGEWRWIKKRKRRSKRLATTSDINDLSALKGVLGDGKNLSTWIATHR